MSGIEIERKFLVKDDSYKQLAFADSVIRQGYLCDNPRCTVRVRLRAGEGSLTIKGPSDGQGLSRYEFEKKITADEASALLALCPSGIIDKRRYLVRAGKHVFEVDEFHGANEGLTVAEIELGALDEPFDILPFIGEEVTGDARYYNLSLSRCPFSTWGTSSRE